MANIPAEMGLDKNPVQFPWVIIKVLCRYSSNIGPMIKPMVNGGGSQSNLRNIYPTTVNSNKIPTWNTLWLI